MSTNNKQGIVNRRLIEKQWLSLVAETVREDVSPAQLKNHRRSFYAGARGLLSAVTSEMQGALDNPQRGDLDILPSIEVELQEFADDVRNGLK